MAAATGYDFLKAMKSGEVTMSLPGANHGATQNRDQRGRPERVAPALLDFFR